MSRGIAVLHGYDPQTGGVSTDEFMERPEDEGTTSPWHRALALKVSVQDDFPGWIWSIGQNDRSHYLMYVENMRRIGLSHDDYETWIKNWKDER